MPTTSEFLQVGRQMVELYGSLVEARGRVVEGVIKNLGMKHAPFPAMPPISTLPRCCPSTSHVPRSLSLHSFEISLLK